MDARDAVYAVDAVEAVYTVDAVEARDARDARGARDAVTDKEWSSALTPEESIPRITKSRKPIDTALLGIVCTIFCAATQGGRFFSLQSTPSWV